MSGLANRLVAAASPDVWAVTEACTPEQIDMLARKVVVTVLMTLAESGQVAWAESLAGLAEVIEKGEQT